MTDYEHSNEAYALGFDYGDRGLSAPIALFKTDTQAKTFVTSNNLESGTYYIVKVNFFENSS